MSDFEKISLFVVLRALDRLSGLMGVMVPKEIEDFISNAWSCFASGESGLNTRKVKSAVDLAVIDEQDATPEEVLRNLFLYALSDLVVFFDEGAKESLAAAEASVVDAYDYVAAQQYVFDTHGGKAVILSGDEEREIKESALYSGELSALTRDRRFAETFSESERLGEFR